MPTNTKVKALLESEQVKALLQKRALRIRQVAALLDMHPDTIRRWVEESKLAAFRLPSGQLRIRTDSVKALL